MRVEPTCREHCRVEWQVIVRFRIVRQNPEELSGIEQWLLGPKNVLLEVCRRMCRTLRADARQCGLFRYFNKVLPCGLGCGQVVDFRW
jgi:hypothetical protein